MAKIEDKQGNFVFHLISNESNSSHNQPKRQFVRVEKVPLLKHSLSHKYINDYYKLLIRNKVQIHFYLLFR